MNSMLDATQIRNILTIRYDPRKSSKNQIISKIFSSTINDLNGFKTEKILLKIIKNYYTFNDKPIAISISSGIDSTLLLAIIRKCFPEQKIIGVCGIFEDGFDESITAKKIAKKFDASFYPVKMGSIFSSMPEIISITGKPKWNTYTHLIAKNAKKFTTNFVTGDGADEIFGGYTFRYEKFLGLSKPDDTWVKKAQNYLECHNRDWVPDQHKMFGNQIKFNWNKILKYFKPYFNNELNLLNQVIFADYNGKLIHDFIPLGKSIEKYYGLNSFSPFQQHEVVELGMNLPISQKFDNKTKRGKLVLRKISKRLGINHIDDKKGFSPSLLYDWKKNGKKICENYILQKDSDIYKQKLINFDWVLNAVEKVENDGDIRYLNRLISILALEIWIRLFVLKTIDPKKPLK